MRQQLAKMIASQLKLIASIRFTEIKIASVNAHVIMHRVLIHVQIYHAYACAYECEIFTFIPEQEIEIELLTVT